MGKQITRHMDFNFQNIVSRITGKRGLSEAERKNLFDYTQNIANDLKNQSTARKQAIDKIIQEQVDRIKQDIKSWRDAIAFAEDPICPDPFYLYQLYTDILDDDQVYSTMQQRIAKSVAGNISLKNLDNKINKEATAVLIKPDGTPKPWFREFLKIAMKAKFYGYSITQFRPPVNNDFVINMQNGDKPVEAIPFVNMVPRWRSIRLDIDTSIQDKNNLIPVYGGNASKWLIAVGNDTDLGLLNKLAPFWIYKKVLGSWTQHAKIFGMPLRVGKTDIYDKARFQNLIDMLKNMDGATWAALHPDDEVEFISNNQGSGQGSDIYKGLIDICDKAISKIILSQTGTTDEKSFAGSAKVHENILGSVIWADKLDLAAIIDERLIPFLKSVGLINPDAKVFSSWDLGEDTTVSEWADIVQKLAGIFELDAKEISQKFNLKLEKKEVIAAPEKPATEEEDEQKKELNNIYKKYFK